MMIFKYFFIQRGKEIVVLSLNEKRMVIRESALLQLMFDFIPVHCADARIAKLCYPSPLIVLVACMGPGMVSLHVVL